MKKGTELPLTIVFSIEPRSYREAIGSTVQHLRPQLRVEIVDPAALDGEVARLAPMLVFADQLATSSRNGGPLWVELRPYDSPAVKMRLRGSYEELQEVDLGDLLGIIDAIYGECRVVDEGS